LFKITTQEVSLWHSYIYTYTYIAWLGLSPLLYFFLP
jgi:hypothetical protein